MKWDFKKFALAAFLRAVRTFAQAFLAACGVEGFAATFADIDWIRALSISGVAFLLSLVTSVATGLPEVKQEPPEEIDTIVE